MQHLPAIELLRASLEELKHRRTDTASFCRTWRAQSALLDALPGRYRQVMEDLLGRMEAGSLFTEESCSFSQEDLRASLSVWLDKAQQALEA
ncbi:MAG TPA: hypothetical protein VEC01_05870 [Noviherbaspirillum sp.]|uniref:hypothetical protein n=1 Tax=Noviherbaspirillum sp. TaxID=1926288 RepID=UPI002D50E0F3|nr:hypothetical protein [Noviherbaspirillum sp.]HYD94833.1 hypothetical protein [Noviherbaspirillum sp.]